MKQKTLIGLGIAAAVVVVGAMIAVQRQQSSHLPELQSGLLFDGLMDKAATVAAIKLESGADKLTLTGSDDRWAVAEKGGYPARFELVKTTIVAMASIETITAKTADPARFADLGLADPDAEQGAGTRITLVDAAGAELAAMVLGEPATGGGNKRYVRRIGDDQTWLAETDLNVVMNPLAWISTDLLDIQPDRVQRISITTPEGGTALIEKPDRKAEDYALKDMPEGHELRAVSSLDMVVAGLSGLRAEDVAPRDQVMTAEAPRTVARFETYEGLVVTAESITKDDKTWASFSAAFDPALVVPEAPIVQVPGETTAKDETGEDQDADAEEPFDAAKTATELNQKLAGWAYQIPQFKANQLTAGLDDLTKPIKTEDDKEPSSEGEPNAAPDPAAAIEPQAESAPVEQGDQPETQR